MEYFLEKTTRSSLNVIAGKFVSRSWVGEGGTRILCVDFEDFREHADKKETTKTDYEWHLLCHL
jgi:hypothetical protein